MTIVLAVDGEYAGFYIHHGVNGFRVVLGYVALTLLRDKERIFMEAAKQLAAMKSE